MKRLLLLPLLLIASCSEEPSLLDKCIEANIERINFENKFLDYWSEREELREMYFEAAESSGNDSMIDEWVNVVIALESKFTKSLTDTESSLWEEFLGMNPNTKTNEEVFLDVKSLQAKAIDDAYKKANKYCNLQGIY